MKRGNGNVLKTFFLYVWHIINVKKVVKILWNGSCLMLRNGPSLRGRPEECGERANKFFAMEDS